MAQAIYSGGSFFNHSCQPNAHAYFLSRSLLIRATENVIAGSDLELSYGPQVDRSLIILVNSHVIIFFRNVCVI